MASKRMWKKRIFSPEQRSRRMANQREYRRRLEVRGWLLPYKRAEAKRYRARYRIELRDRARDYRERNSELLLRRKHEHYAKNKERILAAQREYACRNRDAASRRRREYYVRNRERILAYMRRYAKEHRDLYRANRHARRAREIRASGRCTAAEFARLIGQFEGRCAYCGGTGPLTADHRTPLSRPELQPTNDIGNILPACRPCNSSKGRKTETEFREWLARLLRTLSAVRGLHETRLREVHGLSNGAGTISPVRPWPLAVAAAIAIPLGALVYVITPPASEARFDDAVQHFTITTNVSLIAAAVSIAVIRPALAMRHWPSVLTALGFMALAGLFAVHGLTTPGVLLRGGSRQLAAESLIAISAQLSLGVPALLFAARYTPLPGWLERSRAFTPRRALAVVATAIIAFGVGALLEPVAMSGMVEAGTGYGAAAAYGGYGGTALQGNPIWILAASGTTVVLLVFAAYRESAEFVRNRLPTRAATAIAFLFLAEAQVAMVVSPVFSGGFWQYHGLMALAALLAMAALFLELDRRRGLERFLPSAVVDRVLAGDATLAGERRTVTILFADLRGSTALADSADPERSVAVINGYVRAFASSVLDHGGIIDKFTGDGVMAIFGAQGDRAAGGEEAVAAGARDAVAAALEMRKRVATLTAERQAAGQPTLAFGVGVHHGEVVLGAVGLPERSDYTALGDTVNTAARMEELTKELGVDIVVSAAVARLLEPGSATRIGEVQIRGKIARVEVFGLA